MACHSMQNPRDSIETYRLLRKEGLDESTNVGVLPYLDVDGATTLNICV